MIRASLLVALGGCFADFGLGPSITPHAPPPPSGDGGYYRAGLGVGWGTEYGTLQASGDILAVGDVEAAGGALQAAIFVTSDPLPGVGWQVIARGFVGSGIGDTDMTEELSLGVGWGAWAYKDITHWAFDNLGMMVSAYRTTFADRSPMWSYGLSITMTLDPGVLGGPLSGGRK